MEKMMVEVQEKISVIPYRPEIKSDWDLVLENSINGTFLHRREFMEYHGDKFEDASLVIYNEDSPVAIFPAELKGDQVYSHRGLTYAGWILVGNLEKEQIREVVSETLAYFKEKNVLDLTVRMVPDFFAKAPQEDLKKVLMEIGAKEIFTAIHHCTKLPYKVKNRGKRWGNKKAISHGLEIRQSYDVKYFWEKILIPNLKIRHKVNPTHSLNEIQNLISVFPDKILFFGVFFNVELLGGAIVFLTDTTVHLQYIASTDQGRVLKCLDYLMSYFLEESFPHKKFFNMGVSHIPESGKINEGLVWWKESFGAHGNEQLTFSLNLMI